MTAFTFGYGVVVDRAEGPGVHSVEIQDAEQLVGCTMTADSGRIVSCCAWATAVQVISRRGMLLGTAGFVGALVACRGASGTAAPPRTTPAPPTPTASTASTAPATSMAPTASTTPPVAETLDPSVGATAIAARSHVPILCYHQIRDWTSRDGNKDRPYIMPPDKLREQLDQLVVAGYQTITPDQLLAFLTLGTPLPPKPVMLSFDDDTEGQFEVAIPELQYRNFTAMFFIMTVALDKPGYLTTDQVRQLDAAGMTIAAHTWDHHRVDQYSGDDWRIQIEEPPQKLAEILGHPIRYFAYPYGVWNADAFAHLEAAGIVAAFQLDQLPVDPTKPLLTIQRKIANPYWTPTQFDAKVTAGF
jgi:peptidoglycan/xylan/chitin deacetylase (PgdA/CDA1 family)